MPMRLAAVALCALLLFCACATQAEPVDNWQSEDKLKTDRQLRDQDPTGDPPGQVHQPDPDPSQPPQSPEEAVQAFFDYQYRAYIDLEHIDFSYLLDMDERGNRNLLIWLELLSMRRRLIWEYDLCYVERERFDYEIYYINAEDLEDQRMAYWDEGWIGPEETVLHFVIEGEEGRAYPPTLAVNSQHTMRFRQREDGSWEIIFHYFPGSVRKFYLNNALAVPEEGELLNQLMDEFAPWDDPQTPDVPAGATAYDGALAAQYARRYTEEANPDFYHIGDWMGNCSNFTSQCVWYGFGGGEMPDAQRFQHMTGEWYGGKGGGSPAWENVESFWSYVTAGTPLRGQVLDGAEQLREGDLIQTRAGVALPQEMDADADRYNHMMIVVDADTLLLAQNSPGCFVYYSDLVAVESRLVRPVYLDN